MNKNFSIFLIIITSIMAFNIIWLDWQLISSNKDTNRISTQSLSYAPSNTPNLDNYTNSSFSNEEIMTQFSQKIKDATASITQDIIQLKQNSKLTDISLINKSNQVKEYYLPLGTGSTKNSDWTDIPNAEVYLAPTNYGKIVGIYFEAAIRIPTGTGRVYARLKNVTDNIGLFESEVFREGTQTGLISSGKIPIPVTTKQYRVQMKSTLGAEAVLDSSRIKLFIE